MHRTTLMISDDLWERVQEQAAQRGISASQYIREAVIAVLYYELAQAGDRDIANALLLARKLRI